MPEMISGTRVSSIKAGDTAVEAQVAKILASEVFSRSARMSRFLRLIAGNAGADLKEYAIALEVFDRPSNFDPRLDPIVRVEARRLRQKLAEYYASVGREDPIVIDLPKGSYAPDIRSCESIVPRAVPARQFERDYQSVAVLPFLNLGGGAEKDYFVDGLTEELTAVLAQVPDLRVIARTSAFAFRGKSDDVRAIGRKLNARALVEGSVRWSGPRLRVTVQMADCQDGCHLFAESFDVEEKELFALQYEIAHLISGALAPHLADRRNGVVPQPPRRVDAEAHRLYLRGRHHWNRRTITDLAKAIAYCERAIAIQPDYAEAYACIADACWVQCLDMLAPSRDLLPKAKAAAERALDLHPGLAEAHTALGVVCMYDWNHELGGSHMRRAIEVQPSYATAHYVYACNLAVLGHAKEALSEIRTALDFDPLSIMVNRAMVACFCEMGKFDCAVAQAKEAVELDPSFYGSYLYLAWAYMGLGEHHLAIEALEQANRLGENGPVMLGYVAASKAQLGQREEAESILCQLLDPAQPFYVPPLVVAGAFVALGQVEEALNFLERAVEERCGTIFHLRHDPFFVPLHGMPRFDDLCHRMNLT